VQTREHLFKECSEWKAQWKILWAEVQKETGRWKARWKVRDLLADERCVRPVLDFLTNTDVGRLAPPLDREDDAVSAVSELEVREFMVSAEGGRGGGHWGNPVVPTYAALHGIGGGTTGDGQPFPL